MTVTLKKYLGEYWVLALAAVIFLFMGAANPYYFSPYNIWGLFDAMPAYGIAAVGLTFVMIAGQLDISMGSVMALTSCVFLLILPRVGFFPAMALALLLGCLLGAFTGFFVAFFRLPPFIVTMTMQLAYKGIAFLITGTTPVSVTDPTLMAVNQMSIGPIPVTFFFFLLVALLAQLVLSRTSFGRNLFVIGGNIQVADNLGLRVREHVWSAFIIQGFCAALGGIVMMTRIFSASGNLALDGPLNIIPMVIVGGTAFSGGKGGTLKTLCGVVLMNIVYNAMSMFNIYVNIQELIKGAILLLIVVSGKYLENRNQKV